MTDKLNEMILAAFAVVGTIVGKRIFTNHDTLSERITALEKTVVTKHDLIPLERTTGMILSNMLNKKE